MPNPSIIQDVTAFFETASPIKYSLILTSLAAIVLVSMLLFCACYLQVPQILTKFLCCVSNNCCLKRRALKRTREQTQLRVFYSAANEFQPAQTSLLPSAPIDYTLTPAQTTADTPMTSFYTAQTQLSGNCINNLSGCYCARFGARKPILCKQNCQNN